MPSNILAIDLFCGAGGLTNGLRSAGVNVVAGIDNDEKCQHAYEHNNKPAKFLNRDIKTVSGGELNELWNGSRLRLLAGCAPCQPFSSFRQAQSAEIDERYPLLFEFSRLIRETKPEFITMENVPNVIKKAVFNTFLRSLYAQGYKCNFKVVKCEEYELAQSRRRLVLLASRIGPAPEFPAPGESKKTVKDVLFGIPRVKAGETHAKDKLHRCASLTPINLSRIRASKPGGTWRDWPEEILLACHKRKSGDGYTPVYGRMSWDKPAPTITTQCYNFGSGRFGHPTEDRPITMREAAILQGFPADYEFEPPSKSFTLRDIARMIGNAVPVDLGKMIGHSFLQRV